MMVCILRHGIKVLHLAAVAGVVWASCVQLPAQTESPSPVANFTATTSGMVHELASPEMHLPVVLESGTSTGLVQGIVVDENSTSFAESAVGAAGDDGSWIIREALMNQPHIKNLTRRYEAPGMSAPPGWDPNEYATLRSTAGPRPTGELGLGLTDSELLRTDPVAAAIRRDEAGLPYFGTGPEADPALNVPLGEDGLMLSSADFMDYDQERSIVYGHGHMVARLGAFRITADRMLYNTKLRRLEAYGNIRIVGPGQSIEAQSLVLDTLTFEGAAFKARGEAEGVYFLADPWKKDGRAELRLLSRQESVLKDAAFTTCDFPVPHWRLQAKEILVRPGDRVFARSAVLYIHDVPVMWLPFATQNLGKEFPWFASVGRTERTGYYVRTGYRFEHEVSVPDETGSQRQVSSLRAALLADYFAKRGFGYGVDGRYSFEQTGTRGRLFAYSISDSERSEDNLGGGERNIFRWQHHSQITPNLRALINADWVSDPEVYYDVLDQLGDGAQRRQRMFERSVVGGLEYTKDDLYAGLQVRLADRISRNRASNPSDPRDNDNDFDRQFNEERFYNLDGPGVGPDGVFRSRAGRYTDVRSIPNSLEPGVRSDRLRRTIEKIPALSVSTGRKQIGNWPLYLETKLDAFRALDAGFNQFDSEDDSTVTGFNLRQSLTHQMRLGQRTTWINRFGYGVGSAEREEDGITGADGELASFPFALNGSEDRPFLLTGPDEFLIGRKRRSFSSVRSEFAHVNYESILNSRITDSLSGYLRLRLEEVTKDSLGEFYRSIGDIRSRDAIYPFPLNERLLEAGWTYALLSPRLTVTGRYGENLESSNQLAPNEVARYFNLNGNWSSPTGVWTLSPGMSLQQRQFLDPSDPSSFLENSRTIFATAGWNPVHMRQYANVSAYLVRNEESSTDGDLNDNDSDRGKSTSVISTRLGQKIGTKYLVEYEGLLRTESDTPSENVFRLSRDFHDLIATVAVGVKERELSPDREGTRDGDNVNVRFDFQFKPAGQRGVQRVTREGSLFPTRRASESRE